MSDDKIIKTIYDNSPQEKPKEKTLGTPPRRTQPLSEDEVKQKLYGEKQSHPEEAPMEHSSKMTTSGTNKKLWHQMRR